MRIGLYADAFNVYYGARAHCGRGNAGWRWLDLPALAMGLINEHLWSDPVLTRFAYCTADRAREGDQTSIVDQATYIAALQSVYPQAVIATGFYVPRVKTGIVVDHGHPPQRVPSPGPERLPDWLPVRATTGPPGSHQCRPAPSFLSPRKAAGVGRLDGGVDVDLVGEHVDEQVAGNVHVGALLLERRHRRQ